MEIYNSFVSVLCSSGYSLLVTIYLCTSLVATNNSICKNIKTWIESMFTACCRMFLGTPRGIFDNQDILEDHDLRINRQKLSMLSLITLTSYTVSTFLVICETSLRVYMSIDGFVEECKDNYTCLVTNELTKGQEIRHDCSTIEENENITFHGCYKVSYKYNEALATAGGLLTAAKLIPQVLHAVFSICANILRKIPIVSNPKSYYLCNIFFQLVSHLLMLFYNLVCIPIFFLTIYGFPTSVLHSIDELNIFLDKELLILMGSCAIGAVMMNTIIQQETGDAMNELTQSQAEVVRKKSPYLKRELMLTQPSPVMKREIRKHRS